MPSAPGTDLLPPATLADARHAVGRDWVSARISDWLRGPQRFFLLTGGPGTGKTTVAALALCGDDTWAAAYFCSTGIAGFSLHPRQFIGHLGRQLQQRFPAEFRPVVDMPGPAVELHGSVTAGAVSGVATGINLTIGNLVTSPMSLDDHFQTVLIEPLRAMRARRPDLRAGILIDGLDESLMAEEPTIVHLLHRHASAFPDNCKILLTAQNRTAAIGPFRRIDDLSHLDLSSTEYRDDVLDDVTRFVAREIGESAGAGRIAAVAGGNYLHAAGLARDIRKRTGQPPGSVAMELDDYYLRTFSQIAGRFDADPRQQAGTPGWTRLFLPVLHWLAALGRPVPTSELAAWLDWDEVRLLRARAEIEPFVTVDADRKEIGLQHNAVAEFLRRPELPGWRSNDYGMAPGDLSAMLLDRAGDRFAREWRADWRSAHPSAVAACAHHLRELSAADADRAAARAERLDPRGLAARVAEMSHDLPDPATTMSDLVHAAGRLPSPDALVEAVLMIGAGSENPYVRSVVVDGIAARATGRRIVRKLLASENQNAWTTALSATMLLGAEDRDDVVRWLGTKAPPRLRQYSTFALYLAASHDVRRIERDVLQPVVESISLLRPFTAARALDFLASISITTYTNNCDSSAVAEATSTLWRRVTIDRLKINLLNRPMLERPLMSVTARRLARKIADVPVLRSEVGRLSPADVRDIRSLLPGLTPGRDLEPLMEPLRRAFGAALWLPRVLAACVLSVQAIRGAGQVEPVLDELYRTAGRTARLSMLAGHCLLIGDTPRSWAERLPVMTRQLISTGACDGFDDPLLSAMAFASLPLSLIKHGHPTAEVMVPLLADHTPGPGAPVRSRIVEGLTVAGLYHPLPVLDTLRAVLLAPGCADLGADVRRSLRRLRFVHAPIVDALSGEMGIDMRTDGGGEAEGAYVWRHVEVLGLYNNAVNQAVRYPRMRDRLLSPGFLGLAEARDAEEFVQRYVPRVLALLRETDYDLLRWLDPA